MMGEHHQPWESQEHWPPRVSRPSLPNILPPAGVSAWIRGSRLPPPQPWSSGQPAAAMDRRSMTSQLRLSGLLQPCGSVSAASSPTSPQAAGPGPPRQASPSCLSAASHEYQKRSVCEDSFDYVGSSSSRIGSSSKRDFRKDEHFPGYQYYHCRASCLVSFTMSRYLSLLCQASQIAMRRL